MTLPLQEQILPPMISVGIHHWVDLRSDTVTLPSPFTRKALLDAEVGDEVYGDDPSVNRLQTHVAKLFGKEAALFVSSGTHSNLLAVGAHCGRGEAVILGDNAHIFNLEAMNASVFLGVGLIPVPIDTSTGLLEAKALARAVSDPDSIYAPKRTLLALESPLGNHGGKLITPESMREARKFADEHNLKIHVDGARMHLAAAATDLKIAELVAMADSISVCYSKTVGAPFGGVLVGSAAFIHKARRMKKCLGGFGRQSGHMANAALAAEYWSAPGLKQDIHNARLTGALLSFFSLRDDADHRNHIAPVRAAFHDELCKILGLSKNLFNQLISLPALKGIIDLVQPALDTNIILFRFTSAVGPDYETLNKRLFAFFAQQGFGVISGYGVAHVRFVFHYGISKDDAIRLLNYLLLFLVNELVPPAIAAPFLAANPVYPSEFVLQSSGNNNNSVKVNSNDYMTQIVFQDGESATFCNPWLRDHASESIDPATLQRVVLPSSIPSLQRVVSASLISDNAAEHHLQLVWDTPVSSSSKIITTTFTLDELRKKAYAGTPGLLNRSDTSAKGPSPYFSAETTQPWSVLASANSQSPPGPLKELDLFTTSVDEMVASNELQIKAHQAFSRNGVISVSGITTQEQALALSAIFGGITSRETALRHPKITLLKCLQTTAAFKAEEIEVDLLYSLQASASNNPSMSLVDGLAVAEDLRVSAPRTFEFFCTTEFKFQARDPSSGEVSSAWGHVIELTPSANPQLAGVDKYCKLRFDATHRADLIFLSPSLTEKYYVHSRILADVLEKHTLQYRTAASECLVIHNRRVLHGFAHEIDLPKATPLQIISISRDAYSAKKSLYTSF